MVCISFTSTIRCIDPRPVIEANNTHSAPSIPRLRVPEEIILRIGTWNCILHHTVVFVMSSCCLGVAVCVFWQLVFISSCAQEHQHARFDTGASNVDLKCRNFINVWIDF